MRVTTNVKIPHGNRMNKYSVARQPTGSFSAVHSQGKNPRPWRCRRSGLGSSIPSPSSARARDRSARPSPREPDSPSASSGSPITVTDSATPAYSHRDT